MRGLNPRNFIPVRTVKVYPPDEVTTIRPHTEVDPQSVGLSPKDVQAIWNTVLNAYRGGVYPSLALCVRRHGKVILDRAIGHTHGNTPDGLSSPLRLASPDSLYSIFSASKAFAAMIIHILEERGLLRLEDRVAEYLPGFASRGKELMTIRHLLAHRAGIPRIPQHLVNLEILADEQKILQALSEVEPSYRPGQVLAYHPLSAGFVLGAVAKAVTGKNLRQLLDEIIIAPLGFTSLSYGVSAQRVADIAPHECTGLREFQPFSYLMKKSLGVGFYDAFALANDPRFLQAIIPAANIIGTAHDISRFYQLILQGGELDGVRIFNENTMHRAVSEQSFHEMDRTMLLPIRYGLGFMLGAKYLSIYGKNTDYAFGHMGFTNILTWADPERGIAASLMTSGQPFVSTAWTRWIRIPWTIASRCPRDGFAWLSSRKQVPAAAAAKARKRIRPV